MERANNRVYEEYNPTAEWIRHDEADSVKIVLPGFKREDIRVLVDNHGHLRTHGERPIAGTRWSRFQRDFPPSENYNVDGIRAKFENETLTITLPKKTPSPPSAPVTPQPLRMPVPEPPRGSVAAPAPIPERAATLAPAASHRPPAERRPSLPRKPPAVEPAAPELPARLPSVPTPALGGEPQKKYNGGAAAATRPEPSLGAVPRSREEEEEKRRERETMGKMEEDRKAAAQMKEKGQEQQGDAAMGELTMAGQPRPAAASRGLMVNVAVAVVVLLGITVYVWHTLRNATGGHGHGHGHLGAGSYRDEM